MDFTAGSSAVLALHWQNDIVGADGAFAGFFAEQIAARQVVPATRALIDGAREVGVPVIYVRVCWAEGHPGLVANNGLFAAVKEMGALVDGTAGADVIPALAPREGDDVVSHQTMSPFVGGDLERVLRERGVETVLLAGVATNVVVDEVARGAVNRAFNAVVVADCCAAATRAAHDAAVETLGLLATEVTDLQSVLGRIGAAGVAS